MFEVVIENKENYTLVKINTKDDVVLRKEICDELKKVFTEINENGQVNIVVDMAEVKIIDSNGLSSLLLGNRLCKNSGGALILVAVNEAVKKLIGTSQLGGIFNLVTTIEEAISFYNEQKEKA